QSTLPLPKIETAGCSPPAISSASRCAPSRANFFADSGAMGCATVTAEASTRKRSCGSGWGSATAMLTTSSANFFPGGGAVVFAVDAQPSDAKPAAQISNFKDTSLSFLEQMSPARRDLPRAKFQITRASTLLQVVSQPKASQSLDKLLVATLCHARFALNKTFSRCQRQCSRP